MELDRISIEIMIREHHYRERELMRALEITRETREEQKRFFKTKNVKSLDRCKRLESELDEKLDEILGVEQMNLFE